MEVKIMGSLCHAMIMFLFLLLSDGTSGENVKLTLVPENAEENSSVLLSCDVPDRSFSSQMVWKLNDTISYTVNLTNNNCKFKNPPHGAGNYILNCSKHTISMTIRNVDRLQHGDKWTCIPLFTSSNIVTIFVTVPVKKLDIWRNDTGFIAENDTSQFYCNTSFSRPKPDIYWYISNGTPDFDDDERFNSNIKESLANKTVGNKNDNILTSTKSELAFKVQRSMNNQQIYCQTNDTSGRVLRSTMQTLNVSYPPDGAPYIRENATYNVINTFQGNMTCIVTGGNPLPNLNWDCLKNGTETTWRSNTTAASEFTWIASMHSNTRECTCRSCWLGKQSSANVKINVLYPPSVPKISILSNNGSWHMVSSEINIKENNFLTMTCRAQSNPVSSISWTGPKSSFNETLKLNVTDNEKEGNYTCSATNVMTQTNGTSLEGTKNNSIRVNVLYPPSGIAFTIQNQSTDMYVSEIVNMFENASYVLRCHARGKPEPKYSWTGPVNIKTDVLNLTNTNRNMTGNYTCEAKNTINESTGDIHNEREHKSIYLNIQYASEVTEFIVSGHKENNTVITNQRENATFICKVDSNPSSTVCLKFKDNLLVNNKNTTTLTYFIKSLQCSSAGIYYCFSFNEINNGKRSSKHFALIVKCPPLPEKDLNFNVTTLKYVSATLSFKAMDYLDSNNTTFTWQRENNTSQWVTVTNDNKDVKISTFHLQTNLTVVNVTGYYSGNYRVVYNNSVGGNTHMFQLSVADLPDKPTSFDYLKDSLTYTQVTIVWTKGYGGGLRQTFVINISQRSQPIKYDYINETEKEDMQHTITGLSSGTQYKLTLWATNMLGKSLSQTLTIITKEPELDVETTSKLTAPIAGSVSSLAALAAGALVAFLLYRRRSVSATNSDTGKLVYQNVPFEGKKQKNHLPVNINTQELPVKKKAPDNRGKNNTQEETSFQVLQEVDDMPPLYNERTEYYNSAEKIAEIEKIKVLELLPYVLGRGEESFEAEYQKLPTGLQHPCTFARKPENIALNRYNGIYPYDHSRVKIEGMPDFFINACYINGYTREREYIASLGPTKKVTYAYQSFWLMVWNEHSDIIVMLTNLHEPSGMKCEQYWPEYGTTKCYGDIQVSSDKEEVFAEYTVRNFIVLNSGEKRSVTHLHYTTWPDKKVPEDVTTLIEFRERLKATASTGKGPVIVHCSAGIGRTGTLIALDRLIKEGQNESSVDVFKCVNSMREQRVKMVQTLEQYIYIYKALVNSLYFDSEMIPIESFREYVDTTNNNIYSKQFQQLKETVEGCIKDKSDTHAESEMLVDKNRRGADIPGRQFRVLVYLNRNTNDSDYINAVYVNSLRIKDHFILAQTPLPNTVTDFVCMMYQENCCCVVTMEDLKEPGMKVGHYLPTDGHSLKFGDITISCTVLETKPQYTVREIRLQNNRQTENREKVAYHFHYTKWMQVNDTPTDAKEFVQFIKDVEDYADQLGEEQSHVLVHCLKANERSALYCIVTILIEKMRYERQVSVLNTVRHLRTRRRTAITSMEQLKFCYQALNAYISLYEQ